MNNGKLSLTNKLDFGNNVIRNLARGTKMTDGANIQNILESQTNLPIGTIIQSWGTLNNDAWLYCNGSQFNKYIYGDLYNFLGTDILPDLRGYCLRGFDDGRGIDYNTNRQLNDAQQDGVGVHSHNYSGVVDIGGDHVHSIQINEQQSGEHYHAYNETYQQNMTISSNQNLQYKPIVYTEQDGTQQQFDKNTNLAGGHIHNITAQIGTNGQHQHNYSGTTHNYGINETVVKNISVKFYILGKQSSIIASYNLLGESDTSLNGYKLVHVGDPVDNTDCVNKQYLLSQLAGFIANQIQYNDTNIIIRSDNIQFHFFSQLYKQTVKSLHNVQLLTVGDRYLNNSYICFENNDNFPNNNIILYIQNNSFYLQNESQTINYLTIDNSYKLTRINNKSQYNSPLQFTNPLDIPDKNYVDTKVFSSQLYFIAQWLSQQLVQIQLISRYIIDLNGQQSPTIQLVSILNSNPFNLLLDNGIGQWQTSQLYIQQIGFFKCEITAQQSLQNDSTIALLQIVNNQIVRQISVPVSINKYNSTAFIYFRNTFPTYYLLQYSYNQFPLLYLQLSIHLVQ